MQEESPQDIQRHTIRDDEVTYTIETGSPESTGARFYQVLTDSQTEGTQAHTDFNGMNWSFAVFYREPRVLTVEGINAQGVRGRLQIFDMDGCNLSQEGNRATNHAAQVLNALGFGAPELLCIKFHETQHEVVVTFARPNNT